MDMHKKLMDLYNEAYDYARHKCDYEGCDQCPAEEKPGLGCFNWLQAQYLIAHGVTVLDVTDNNVGCKWISVNDRLPKAGERVLVCIGAVFEAFIDDDGKWQRYYSAPLNEVLGEPTHWMPLPQPPKGE